MTTSTPGRFRLFVRRHQLFSGLVGAGVSAVVALGVAYGPAAAARLSMRAEIDVPASIDRCARLDGRASVPDGKSLWLIAETPHGMYAPMQPINVDSDGRWTTTRTTIGDDTEAGKEFVFHLIALPEQWAGYLAEIDKRDPLPTVALLPPGADVLDSARTTRGGSQDRCP